MKTLLKLMVAGGIVMIAVAICIEKNNIIVGGIIMIILSAIFLAIEETENP